jgi:endonuclease/exonuclease/phosphatase family metal-dependent hydrolase
VTWNVQFDRFSGQTTPLGKPGIEWCTKTRYVALSKVLATTDADIIALQETEPTWWEFLSRQPWVQQNYTFSCPMRGEPITPWGQLMLVNKRVPVVNMAAHNVPGYTGHTSVMPTCSVQINDSGKQLNVCGIHLLAPYTQSNINVRVTQIETLMKRLAPKNVGEDVVVMGDFNDYPSNFFVMPQAMGAFRDAWVEKNGTSDGDAGYSINGRTSKYTSLIIEPEFFGRADRVLVKSQHLAVTGAQMIGTKSVREELGIASCPEYLFPSDHYGVMVTMDVKA